MPIYIIRSFQRKNPERTTQGLFLVTGKSVCLHSNPCDLSYIIEQQIEEIDKEIERWEEILVVPYRIYQEYGYDIDKAMD